jgi:hypothetical protein
MRTLQEKYNGINEGAFSKEQFLRDARLQLPNLITQYNGFGDAVQILKNRGMIREAFNSEESFKDYSDDALTDMIINSSRFEGNEEGLARVKAELSRRKKGVQEGETTSNIRQVGDKVSVYGTNNTTYLYSGEVLSVDGDNVTVGKFSGARPSTGESQITVPSSRVKSGKDLSTNEKVVNEDEYTNFSDGQKLRNKNSGAVYTVDGKDGTGGIYVRTEKGIRRNVPAEHFSIYEPVNEVQVDTENTKNVKLKNGQIYKNVRFHVPNDPNSFVTSDGAYMINQDIATVVNTNQELKEARLTNKSLTDYRFKPTNDLDKYPYEQILRGLRVELEGMQVTNTPTTEEYKKALAKVLKNLHADEIFYTNQLAGTDKKVDNHDQLISVQGKEKEIKNSIDTYNGLKKAALKEGFKTLIKKVLNEDVDPLRDYTKSKDDHSTKSEVCNYSEEDGSNSMNEAPAVNNPKIEKLVMGINDLISKAVDQDGDPIGVIWPGGTWDEPYIYEPVQYRNGQLRVTSKSVYGGEPETEMIRSREMELDGIPMLRTLMRMYKKAVKNSNKPVNEGLGTEGKTLNLTQLSKIAMKAGNFGLDVKDALLNLYMTYEDKVPVTVVAKVLEKYDLTFKDLKDQPATFRPSSEFAHLFNSSNRELDEVGVDVTGASNATGAYEIMMHMLDANISNRSEAAKFFSLNHSDMPSQQIKFLINHYFEEFQDEEDSHSDQVDEIATDIEGFPKWRELSQDEKDHIAKSVKDSGDRDQAEYEKRREERLKDQSARLDAYLKSQRGIQEDFETVTLSNLLD